MRKLLHFLLIKLPIMILTGALLIIVSALVPFEKMLLGNKKGGNKCK
jgi:thiosulfate reductase cytochrome b subunit